MLQRANHQYFIFLKRMSTWIIKGPEKCTNSSFFPFKLFENISLKIHKVIIKEKQVNLHVIILIWFKAWWQNCHTLKHYYFPLKHFCLKAEQKSIQFSPEISSVPTWNVMNSCSFLPIIDNLPKIYKCSIFNIRNDDQAYLSKNSNEWVSSSFIPNFVW